MAEQTVTEKDQKLAEACANCPVCRRARNKQKGIAYWFVKSVENGRCPACSAYARVNGRKAYAPVPME